MLALIAYSVLPIVAMAGVGLLAAWLGGAIANECA